MIREYGFPVTKLSVETSIFIDLLNSD